MDSKPWYLSKTIWTNLIMGVLVVAVPSLQKVITPDVLAYAFGAVNIILRVVSHEKLSLS